MQKTKYIFITGGVCSSIGKGIAAASIGALLKSTGLKVFSMKLDPYINVDPGTMNPYQHGEVYVLSDGAETDLDLGHYERFIGENLTRESSVTTGKIYSEVIAKERQGQFLGGTIQIIPHITNAIKQKIRDAGEHSQADIMLVEIGGTTGDIEGLPFLEALRQMRHEHGHENTLFVHLTLLPYLQGSNELKTKPTQASVRELRSIGIQPDIILARADHDINQELIDKIALFCDVEKDAVIPALTVKSIYNVPLNYDKYKITQLIAKKLELGDINPNLQDWESFNQKILADNPVVKIALVGKYTGLGDAYLSVIESLKIAAYHLDRHLQVLWVDSEDLEKNSSQAWEKLKQAQGVLVPGGFGPRGIEGKILTAQYCRESNVPYLGICLGMQIMSIEFARFLKKDMQYTSQEFDQEGNIAPEKYVIHYLPGQNDQTDKGGTLRLGTYHCQIIPNTKAAEVYQKSDIYERHRHRYEFNNSLKADLEAGGLQVSGINPESNLVEIVELSTHPYMVGCQFHPEFLSRPNQPHPLFHGLIAASIKR